MEAPVSITDTAEMPADSDRPRPEAPVSTAPGLPAGSTPTGIDGRSHP